MIVLAVFAVMIISSILEVVLFVMVEEIDARDSCCAQLLSQFPLTLPGGLGECR